MIELKSLLVRPARAADESDLGYLYRLCQSNGLLKPRHMLSATHFRHQITIRVCPKCLGTADPYWRVEWTDKEMPICLEHGVALIDRCPTCTRDLRSAAIGHTLCQCGQQLGEIQTRALSIQLLAVLTADLAFLPVAVWLGAMDKYGPASKPLKRAESTSIALRLELLERGAHVIGDWPTSFDALCKRHRHWPQGLTGAQLFNEAWPGLRKHVAHVRHPIWKERIEQAVRTHVGMTRNTDTPIIGRNVELIPPVQTQKQIATELGIRMERLPDLLHAASQSPPTRLTQAGRRRRVIDQRAVAEVRKWKGEELNKTQTAELLGWSSRRVQALVSADLISVRNGRFRKADVNRFMQSIVEQKQALNASADHVSIAKAVRRWIPVANTAEFVKAIQSGELTVFTSDSKKGWPDLQVDSMAVCTWWSKTRKTQRQCLTLSEAAVLLDVKEQVAYELANHGLLNAHLVFDGRRMSRQVSLDEVSRFAHGFISLSKLAKDAGVVAKQSFEWAKQEGLDVVTGPRIDGTRQYFVKRPAALHQ